MNRVPWFSSRVWARDRNVANFASTALATYRTPPGVKTLPAARSADSMLSSSRWVSPQGILMLGLTTLSRSVAVAGVASTIMSIIFFLFALFECAVPVL